MDLGLLMNVTALVVSVTALGISSFFASRQLRSMRISNSAVVAIEMLTRECRSNDFLESEEFVINKLVAAHSPDDGVAALPAEPRKHISRLGFYYSSLGVLSIHDVVDTKLLVSVIPSRARRAWLVLEPYIMAERRLRTPTYLSYFEHLVCLIASADIPQIQRDLGLLRIDEQPEEFRRKFEAFIGRGGVPAPAQAEPVPGSRSG